MKQIISMVVVLACWGALAPVTYACYCIAPEVPEAFQRANAVFLGEVTDIIEPSTADEKAPLPGRFFIIKFKVLRSWKGVAMDPQEMSVLSAQGRYGCFAYRPVNKGETHLVYANTVGDGKSWSIITACTRTTLVGLLPTPKILGPEATDPYQDTKDLDGLTDRAFRFGRRTHLYPFYPSSPLDQFFGQQCATNFIKPTALSPMTAAR